MPWKRLADSADWVRNAGRTTSRPDRSTNVEPFRADGHTEVGMGPGVSHVAGQLRTADPVA